MNPIIYNKFTVFLLTKAMRLSRRFLKRREDYLKIEKENAWKSNFKDGSFTHKLDDVCQIKLYEDSSLSKDIFFGFESDEIRFIQNTLRQGDTFIDIGANIGLFSILASQKVSTTGKIIAFEPTPKTFKRLQENIKLNKCKNIEAREIGLSDSNGELEFFVSTTGHDAWNSLVENEDYGVSEKIKISVDTLDSQLSSIDKSLIKLVKIDVEGWEKFAIQGGEDFFRNYSPLVLVEFTESNTWNAGYMVQDIYDIFSEWGYKWYRIENGNLKEDKKRLHYPYLNLIAKK